MQAAHEVVTPASQMLALGVVLLAAHLGGKLSRRFNLSEVTGQLLGGAAVSPFVLQLLGIISGRTAEVYGASIHTFHFFVFVFLSLVAFGIGEELHFNRLKKVGKNALFICLIQGALTWALITCGFYFIGKFDILESLLIGSIGIATAPAVTFVLMNQLKIEGRLRSLLGSLVVLDDMIEVVIFSILMQLSIQKMKPSSSHFGMMSVVIEIGAALLMAGAIFLVLRLLVRRRESTSDDTNKEKKYEEHFLARLLAEHPSPSVEILLIALATVAIGAGISYMLHWPFLITATFAGFLVANYHSHVIFDSIKIENISAILGIAFFALIGANMDLSVLTKDTLWLVGLYISTRMIGKIAGTHFGCKLLGEDKRIVSSLPSLMLPQAGVAAVEAIYVSAVLGKEEIAAIILPSIVFFEIVGIFLVDRGLRKWRKWVEEDVIASEADKKRKEGPTEAANMLLSKITLDHVLLDIDADSKPLLIEKLVDKAILATDQYFDRSQALQVIAEREKLAPTGFGHGIAMPHCRLMGLEESVLIIGRHKTDIIFGGVDNVPCDLFLLMLTTARDPGEHLRLLSAAAHILGNEKIREKLRIAENEKAFLKVIEDVRNS